MLRYELHLAFWYALIKQNARSQGPRLNLSTNKLSSTYSNYSIKNLAETNYLPCQTPTLIPTSEYPSTPTPVLVSKNFISVGYLPSSSLNVGADILLHTTTNSHLEFFQLHFWYLANSDTDSGLVIWTTIPTPSSEIYRLRRLDRDLPQNKKHVPWQWLCSATIKTCSLTISNKTGRIARNCTDSEKIIFF